MNRRNFLAGLIALPVAGLVAKEQIQAAPSMPNSLDVVFVRQYQTAFDLLRKQHEVYGRNLLCPSDIWARQMANRMGTSIDEIILRTALV